jgi:hypothetical protein
MTHHDPLANFDSDPADLHRIRLLMKKNGVASQYFQRYPARDRACRDLIRRATTLRGRADAHEAAIGRSVAWKRVGACLTICGILGLIATCVALAFTVAAQRQRIDLLVSTMSDDSNAVNLRINELERKSHADQRTLTEGLKKAKQASLALNALLQETNHKTESLGESINGIRRESKASGMNVAAAKEAIAALVEKVEALDSEQLPIGSIFAAPKGSKPSGSYQLADGRPVDRKSAYVRALTGKSGAARKPDDKPLDERTTHLPNVPEKFRALETGAVEARAAAGCGNGQVSYALSAPAADSTTPAASTGGATSRAPISDNFDFFVKVESPSQNCRPIGLTMDRGNRQRACVPLAQRN